MKRILVLLVTILTVLGCSKDESQPKMYKLTVSSNPTEGGTINPTSGEYEVGTEVTLRVNPNTHYIFDKWSGSWSGSETPLTITMDSDKNLVGNFKLLDTDVDGVTDNIDQCNSTPSGLTVDENGCSDSQKDTDEDGITDDLDTCPDTPSGEEVNEIGCSSSQIDTDGDGVMDDKDTCSDTSSGETVDENGCSDSQKDTDEDGITDDIDNCPETSNPNQEDFDNDNIGDVCDDDTDGDGVNDNVDTCPETRDGVPVDENGCMLNPIYLDENGVTIKSYDWGEVGDTGEVNGVTFTIVSEEQLRIMISNNEDLSIVCTSKVNVMSRLFYNSPTFNGNISSWDVSSVTDMTSMFEGGNYNTPTQFNGDISNWDVSSVTSMYGMFNNSQFNGDISSWDVSSVTNMRWMFSRSVFNKDISSWDVSNVTDMRGVFYGGIYFESEFNGDISNWDVSSVTDMYMMFGFSKFNRDISNWDVSNVTNMKYMFRESQFNQNLSSWDVKNVTTCNGFKLDNRVYNLPIPNFTNCYPHGY